MVVIAVSGMPGCGSTTTGMMLAKKLGLKFFSAGNYTKQLAKDEEKIDGQETDRIVEFWKTIRGQSKEHHIAVEEMQQKLADEGDIVIEGKVAIHFLKNVDLKVWLMAPTEVRAERYAKRDGHDGIKARQQLEEKEKSERESWKRIYGFDYFDQEKEADLVIDTSDKSTDKIVDIIVDFIKKK